MKFRGSLMSVAPRQWYTDCASLLSKQTILARWLKVLRLWYGDQHKAKRMFK